MTIEIHIIAYNEQIMLPFTIAHYKRMFKDPIIIVHDNNSTDETVMIARKENCTVIPFTTDGMNDTIQSQIKSQAAMNTTAGWVLCIDCDEECLINDQDLIDLTNRGVELVQFDGWDIFDSVASPWEVKVPMGCNSPGYHKPILLRGGVFKLVEFGAGAHKMERLEKKDGTLVKDSIREYKLLHYKHWANEYNINRSAELAVRQSQENKRKGYSSHFAFSKNVHQQWFDNHYDSREVIIDKRLQIDSNEEHQPIKTGQLFHICTMSSRPQFLQQIYDTIPKEQDIVWHICKSRYTNKLEGEYLSDSRVRVYEIECEDTNTPCKMNYIFHKIIESGVDSYFCIQDDDSHFLQEMYNVFQQYKQKQFLVIGRQIDKDGVTRLQPTLPYKCAIDTGSFLCHSSVLVKEQWPNRHWDSEFYADFDFIDRVYRQFGITRTDLVDRAISVYNVYSDKEDTLEYIRK